MSGCSAAGSPSGIPAGSAASRASASTSSSGSVVSTASDSCASTVGIVASITARLNPIKLFLLAALLNLLGMLPVLWLMSFWGQVRVPVILVLETSVILVALGLLVEALIPKPPFPHDHREDDEQ